MIIQVSIKINVYTTMFTVQFNRFNDRLFVGCLSPSVTAGCPCIPEKLQVV